MEVGHSAFTNEDDDGHVVAERDVDVDNDVDEDVDDDESVESTSAAVCLTQAPDNFAENVGSVQFLAGSPSASQFIDTGSGGVGADNSSALLKTTHIVIHKQTLKGGLVSPLTPLPPPTPATPNAWGRGYRYKWDQSALDPVIPVRCKSSSGELHKAKFGSGMMCFIVRPMSHDPSSPPKLLVPESGVTINCTGPHQTAPGRK